MIEPLKSLDKLWDKIVRARISQRLKATLLVLVTLAILVERISTFFLVKQLADVVEHLLNTR